MKILLVAPPSLWGVKGIGKHGEWSFFDLQKRFLGASAKTYPGEHLGLRSIQAYCEQQGIHVEVINGHVFSHLTVDQTWEEMDRIYLELNGIDIVGFTGTLEMFEENIELAKRVKLFWKDTLTVTGHDFASLNYQDILTRYDQFDVIVRGEGEIAFAELAKALSNNTSLNDVPNIVYKSNNNFIVTPMHPGLSLDSLPFPNRGDLPYIKDLGLAPAIFTSRGCLYRCNYCTTGQVASLLKGTNSYRMRTVDKVVDEIEYLINEHDVKWITFVDDLFVANESRSVNRATEIANEILRRGIKISFKVDCRIDSINEELFRLLYDAGLREIFVGIETASDEQLQFYNKTYNRKSKTQFDFIKEKIDIVHKLGISVSPGILTYHPTVTKQQLKLTIELLDYCNYSAPYPLWSTITVYPNTPLYHEYKKAGWLEGEWPYYGWKFADHKAENHYKKVKNAAKEYRFDFEKMREVFIKAIEEWDYSECDIVDEEKKLVVW